MPIFTKIAYALLFAVLLLEPHVIRGHFFPAASPFVDNVVTITVFLIGTLIYAIHRHDLLKKERENLRLAKESQSRKEELLDSFQHLGLANRRMVLLKSLTSDVLKNFSGHEHDKKRVFEELLNTAVVSIADAEWGYLRIVHVPKNRTLKEVSIHRCNQPVDVHVGNKDLLEMRGHEGGFSMAHGYTFVASSNRASPEACFLILPRLGNLPEGSFAILQAFVDQVLLLYRYAYVDRHA